MADASTNLMIKIGSTADLAAFQQTRAEADALKFSLESLRSLAATLGAGFSIAGLVELVRTVEAMAESTVRLSEQAHISVGAFQALSYAAIDTGMNQDQLAQKLEVLNRNMALASEGTSKQNQAIADLGLDTAELLALPVEGQLAAIAKAYENSHDKTKAWADVIVLLGRNAAEAQQLLAKLGTEGVPERQWWMATPETLQRMHEQNSELEKFGQILLNLGETVWANAGKIFSAAGALSQGPAGLVGLAAGAGGSALASKNAPAASQGSTIAPAGGVAAPAPVEQQRQMIADAIASSPEMIAAQQKLTDAINAEGAAYEDLDQKAARLRAEAKAEMLEAGELAKANQYDKAAQVRAIDMLTDAEKKLAAANKAAADADAEGLKADIKEMNEDYAAAVKLGEAKVKSMEAAEQAQAKMNAVAVAWVEHDYTQTDNEKWVEKRALIEADIARLEEYIQKQQAIANNPLLPTEVSGKARIASQKAGSSLAGAQGQLAGMGPDPMSFYQNFSKDLTSLQNQWGTLQQNMASGLTGIISTSLNTVESNMQKLIMGTETWRKALSNIAATIEGSVVSAFLNMGIKWVATQIMMAVEGKGIAASSAAAMIPIAMAESEVWAAPAALATIASWGGAAIAAPMLVLASMAATQGLALASSGGFFPGDEDSVAGLFHGGEYVFSAPAVRNIGADNLERAHQMAKNPVGVASGGSSAPGASVSHSFHFHQDYNEAFRAAMRSPANHKHLVDVAARTVRQMT